MVRRVGPRSHCRLIRQIDIPVSTGRLRPVELRKVRTSASSKRKRRLLAVNAVMFHLTPLKNQLRT